ncbi:TrmB family transcriptional regulator [Halococcus saccharolyticus]|uniref:TrmB family transcriptional regulator n=1 Tax=Halococcus saccharolyticus DSM 5350 TaxID=1227455 RepID=M0MLY2_9EURY|nr:helix-turn-helix domain-containing protein [Halococcus saccharolyticus]EMA46697.1 TrmB family transcriptional regulator [Halococcus saccharolyticus DSM 5350]
MATDAEQEAVELLQNLGLKEYEAKCFVALTRLPSGTAKDISDIAAVPRTRVYDAVRVLESDGLVAIQHGNPQRFRALSVEEAVDILGERYTDRIDDLERTLHEVEPHDGEETRSSQEVWALSGREAIEARTTQIVAETTKELIFIVGAETALTEKLYDTLGATAERDVDVLVGAVSSGARDRFRDRLPEAEVFETELDWLNEPEEEDEPSIGLLVMVDRNVLLVSSQTDHGSGEQPTESAVYGRGFSNGLVVIARRLLARGLLAERDPAQ